MHLADHRVAGDPAEFGRDLAGGQAIRPQFLEEFDPFVGGYPVPPMPGQVLPELVGVLRASATEAAASASVPQPEREDV